MEKECDQKSSFPKYDQEDLRRMFEALIEKLGVSVEDIEETAYRIKREYEYRKWLRFHNFE